MAITADQVVTVLNENGIDTSDKFASFISQAGPLIQRNALLSQIEKLRLDTAAAAADTQAQIASLTQQIAEIDGDLRSRG